MPETRAEKAQRLVDEGRVNITARKRWHTEARVEGESETYETIVFKIGRFFCTCPWGDFNSYTGDLCAHALAVKLAVERKDKP